jgi:DNA polymerase I
MSLFSPRTTKEETCKLARKINSRKKVVTQNFKIKGGTLSEKIKKINATVVEEFKGQEDNYKLILCEDELASYIDEANHIGELVIDTETTSLNPITCIMAGAGLYVPGLVPSYTPINHVSFITGVRIKEQLSSEIMTKHFKRINEDVKLIFHNCKYDLRVIWNQLGVDLRYNLWFDTMLAAPLLNENESSELKYQHAYYCTEGETNKRYTELFSDVPFTHIPPKYAYFYGAKDAKMTYELYQFQKPFFNYNSEVCKEYDLVDIAKYYEDIELPTVFALMEMEETGVFLDKEYAENITKEFKVALVEAESKFLDCCDEYHKEIKSYRLKNGINCKLDNPIKISSPQQIAILFYDIIGLKPVDRREPRGTGIKILEELLKDEDLKELVQSIIEYRTIAKLLSTYVEKMPKMINEVTGRLHTTFKQHTTETGRLASEDPNLQNLPKRGKGVNKFGTKIRPMFVCGKDKYYFFCDYSQQEPRILAELSQDEILTESYLQGKDLYATMGCHIFEVDYDTATSNKEEYREPMKPVILGAIYDRTAHTISIDLDVSKKVAQNMLDKFFDSFPGVKEFREESIEFAKENGYVLMLCKRKRRLPEMMLERYSFERVNEGSNYDPIEGLDDIDSLLEDSGAEVIEEDTLEVPKELIEEYTRALDKVWSYRDKNEIINHALEEDGILITDNTMKINETTRKVVNSRIQGSAAIMTKNAMVCFKACEVIKLKHRRPEFYTRLKKYVKDSETIKKYGGKLILQVHDELGMEGDRKHTKKLKEKLSRIMIDSANDLVKIPIVAECDVVERWNGETINV